MPFAAASASSRELMVLFAGPDHDIHSLARASNEPGGSMKLTCSCGSEFTFNAAAVRLRGYDLGVIATRLARLGKFTSSTDKKAA